ncbi:hypothetical protein [Staphylococcus sp. FSL W8-0774]|uniref:hypothetical protein n=1 Tax=Staphylococcus sp. FSL W8-0774 TaxID=2954632 RepID=UPI0030F632AF
MANNKDLIKQLRNIINDLDYKPLFETFNFLNNDRIEYDDLPKVEDIPTFNLLNNISSINKLNSNIDLVISNSNSNSKNLSRISTLSKRHYNFNINSNLGHTFKGKRRNKYNNLKYRPLNISLSLDYLTSNFNNDFSHTIFISNLLKQNALMNVNINNDDEMKKNISTINTLDMPVSNIFINTDDLKYDMKLNDLNDIDKSFDSLIIHQNELKVHIDDVNELSTLNNTIEIEIPKLRYKKVPQPPEEPPEINLNIPDELNSDNISEPTMFNEEVTNYYNELITMGYSEESVELLEGIPDLKACKEFIDYFNEEVSNLKGKAKGLFELQTGKINEIAMQLIIWDELDEFNEFLQEWFENTGSKFKGAYLTEKGLKLDSSSVEYLHLLDRCMVENRGRSVSKMTGQFKDAIQDGESAEKEVYEAFKAYLIQRD